MKNIASGIFLLALSVGYYLAAAKMPTSILDTTVTSAAFPRLLGIAGAIFSLVLIVQGLLAYRASANGAPLEDDIEEPADIRWRPHLRALGLLVIVCLFIVALEVVGYPTAVAALILAVSIYGGYPFSWTSAAVSIGGGVFFWLFFMVFLGIHMPLGIWGYVAALFS